MSKDRGLYYAGPLGIRFRGEWHLFGGELEWERFLVRCPHPDVTPENRTCQRCGAWVNPRRVPAS